MLGGENAGSQPMYQRLTLANPLRIGSRFALFAGLWMVLVGWDPASWIIGLPAAILATWASLRLSKLSLRTLDFRQFLRFVPFFVVGSLRGGADVAGRVLRPRMRIDPGVQHYRTGLASSASRVLFLNGISLLPGTLSADLHQGLISVHALDASQDLAPELAALERRVAALFGETLPGGADD
jgi:multicomponent Na+:H+ antiporter subunit E